MDYRIILSLFLATLFASLAAASTPINDLGTGLYLGTFQGGLYEGGSNVIPADHAAAGATFNNAIVPLDVNGVSSPNGKYILLSIGHSFTAEVWCCDKEIVDESYDTWSVIGKSVSDTAVNKTNLVVFNGAAAGHEAISFDQTTDTRYTTIASELAQAGYSEKQVQAVWIKSANRADALTLTLPSSTADAYTLIKNLGNIVRTLKIRYPNLKVVYVSSRSYGGYGGCATPELHGYEEGFSVKWLIQAQINQMRTGVIDPNAGDLNYNTGVAPWIAWGPYMYTDDGNPRSDGLKWLVTDLEEDKCHPNDVGEAYLATYVLDFFKNDTNTKRWFLNSGAAPPTFDFSLSLNPTSGTVTQGSSTTTTATVTITGSGTVTLTCTGPAGVSCTFTPGTCTSTCTSSVTIATTSSTPTGTQTITITGTSGSLTKSTTFSLTVNTPSSCGTTETWGFESDTASATDTESSAFLPAGWTLISTASAAGTVPDTSFGSTKALGVNGLSGEPFVKAGMTRTSATLTTKVKVLAETGLDVMIAGYVVNSQNWYGIMMAPGIIQFEMQEGGGPRVAGTTSYTWALNTVYTIKLDIRPAAAGGQEARAWVNNVKVIDWTNIGSVLSSGAIGFKVRNAHAHFDDVTVTDFCETTAFDFSLSNSGGITVTQGSSGSNTITATLLSGTTQSVSYTISGLPAGATATFSPASGNPTFTSTLTITTSSTTVSGAYPITVTGTGGGLTRTTLFTLTVNAGGDTTAPTVSITSPANGVTVSGTTNIDATASDNVGVTKVEFLIDGVVQNTDFILPYSFSWNTATFSNGAHTLTAKAYDAANNVGTSSTITVTVSNGAVSTKIPLNDLGTSLYLGLYQGGLYPSGTNTMPSDHASAGATKAASIQPLDTNGNPSATGKIVLVSLGMSNVAQEFCCQDGTSTNSFPFMGQFYADPSVNKTTFAVINGAKPGVTAFEWETDDTKWTGVKGKLTANGLDANQVQIIWMKHGNLQTGVKLSTDYASSEAVNIMKQQGNIIRKAKTHFPNLKILYMSSRTTCVYCLDNIQTEPLSYEQGFSVKWLIEAQINQMRGAAIDPNAGDLNYNTIAPWIAWGPYLWADGATPRTTDGMLWYQWDYEASDGRHPSEMGEQKVGTMLMSFLKNEPTSKDWFLTKSSYANFDFSLTPSSSSITAGLGTTVTNTITINYLSGTKQPVFIALTGFPKNVIAKTTPLSCTPNNTCTISLSIETFTTSPTGTYTITITGTGGATTKTTSFTLTIGTGSSNFDFLVEPSPATGSVIVGGSATTTVKAIMTGTNPSSVTFSCSGLPSGASCAFSPTSCTPNTVCSSTLTISTSSTTPTGTRFFTINAVSGSITKTALYALAVTGTGGDTTAPTVSITSPTNGATVSGTATVTATATDNVGVTRVEFYVDNVLKSTDTTSPYSFSWDTTLETNAAHSLTAKAYDAANNVGTSSAITVTVSNVAACSGNVVLTLTPSTVTTSGSVTPSASDLSSCSGKTISFKSGSCSGTQVSSCTSTSTGCTGPAFTAPSTAATYTYFACIDENGDGDFDDAGESDSELLTVTAPACTLTSASITPVCSGGSSANCEAGESITMSGTYINDCSAADFFQIDASGTGCNIQYTSGDISGISDSTITVSGGTISGASWVIPAIPSTCAGKTITATAAAIYDGGPPGTGTWLDGETATGSFTFASTAPSFDYSLTNSGNIVVTQGSGGSNTITATLNSGSPEVVTLTISGLPSGATYLFSISSAMVPFTSTLTITTAATTLAGSYVITVTGTSTSGLTKITTFTLTVQGLPPTDITPPTVTIINPPANDIVFGTFNVTVQATDNVGVAGVEFYLDSLLRKNDTVSPFDAAINASRITNTTHTIMARAYDAAGNVETDTIIVTVDESRKIADVNGDGDVDLADIIVMILAWSMPGTTDINNDGTTNLIDIGIMLSKWTG